MLKNKDSNQLKAVKIIKSDLNSVLIILYYEVTDNISKYRSFYNSNYF